MHAARRVINLSVCNKYISRFLCIMCGMCGGWVADTGKSPIQVYAIAKIIISLTTQNLTTQLQCPWGEANVLIHKKIAMPVAAEE